MPLSSDADDYPAHDMHTSPFQVDTRNSPVTPKRQIDGQTCETDTATDMTCTQEVDRTEYDTSVSQTKDTATKRPVSLSVYQRRAASLSPNRVPRRLSHEMTQGDL